MGNVLRQSCFPPYRWDCCGNSQAIPRTCYHHTERHCDSLAGCSVDHQQLAPEDVFDNKIPKKPPEVSDSPAHDLPNRFPIQDGPEHHISRTVSNGWDDAHKCQKYRRIRSSALLVGGAKNWLSTVPKMHWSDAFSDVDAVAVFPPTPSTFFEA